MNSKKSILKQTENVSSLTKNLIILLEETGLSRRKLAKLAQMPSTTLDAIIGLHSNPKLDNLVNLARTFKLNVSQLIGELPLTLSDVPVPLLNWNHIDVNSDQINFNLDNNTLYIYYSPTLKHKTLNNRLFALPVDSKISPRYTENSTIVIEETSNFINNDLVLLSISKAPPVIKKIIEDDNELFIKSIASDVTIQPFNNDAIKVFGVIRETRIAS